MDIVSPKEEGEQEAQGCVDLTLRDGEQFNLTQIFNKVRKEITYTGQNGGSQFRRKGVFFSTLQDSENQRIVKETPTFSTTLIVVRGKNIRKK